jgi:hypothetical protein
MKHNNTDTESKDFEYTAGMDLADSIGLIVVCALLCVVFFI